MSRLADSRLLIGLGIALLLVLTIGFGGAGVQPAAAADAETLAWGQYLANFVCSECHTVRTDGDPYQLNRAKLFAGGEHFDGPWGTVYAKNITPDMETGIGSWSEDEIKRAIRDGIAKDGTKLVLMPFQNFRALSDADLTAISAYLKTIPAVRNQVPEAKLAPEPTVAGFIGAIPPLKAVIPPALYRDARSVFHDFVYGGDPAAPKAAPAGFQAPEGRNSVARGEYLVRGLLSCADCHSANLAGGTPPFFAPNITPDRETGIGTWSKESVVRALREGVRPDGRRLSPVMPSGSLAFGNLTDDDVYNVVAYLQSIPAVRRAPGEANPAMGGPPPGPPPSAPTTLPRTGDASGSIPAAAALAALVLCAAGVTLRLALNRR